MNVDNVIAEAFEVLVLLKSAQEHKDIEHMIRYSIDIRYKDDDERRKEYASLLNQDAPTIVTFGKMTAVDCNLVMAQVEIDEGDFYRYRTLTLPIYKIDNQWKVILGVAV